MSKKPVLLMTMLLLFSGMVSAANLTGNPVTEGVPSLIDRQVTDIGPMTNHSSDEGKFDTIGYEISVTFDMDLEELTASANITLRALVDITEINFSLMYTLDVARVRDGALSPLTYHHNKTIENLTVNLTETAGNTFNITVDWSGNTSCSHGNDPIEWENGTLLQKETKWYPKPLNRDLPNFPRPSEYDTYNMTVHALVPNNWTVVSAGELLSSPDDGTNKNFTYRTLHPVTEITLAAAEYVINTTTLGGVTLTTYQFEANATRSGKFMDKAKSLLTWYTSVYGPYPYLALNMVEVTENLGGTESDQMMIYSDAFDATNAPTNSMLRAIAEQYFVHSIITTGPYDAWLTYSFLDYSLAYYQMAVEDKYILIGGHRRYSPNGPDSIRDLSSDDNDFREVIEDKGSYVLHMLRYLIGNTTFDAIINSYTTGAVDNVVNYTNFMTAVTGETITDLDWFWDRWLVAENTELDYTVLIPKKPQIYSEDGQLKVDVTIKKEENAAMPVDLAFTNSTDDIIYFGSKIMDRTESETSFTINVSEAVKEIIIDPYLWLLDMDDEDNIVVPEKDDIWVTAINITPDTDITAGDSVTIEATIRNDGDYSHDVSVKFFDNGTLIGSDTISSLYYFTEKKVEMDWDAVMGERVIQVFADSDEVIPEFNETNNKLEMNVSVAEYIAPPDLYFTGNVTYDRDNVTEGELINITVTVYNDYKLPVTGVTLEFFVDGLHLTNDTLGTIQGYNSTEKTVSWPTTAGAHTIKVVLEPPVGLVETDDDNNEIEGQLTINRIPTAKVDVDESTPFSNEEVEFTGELSNDDGTIMAYYFDFGDGTFKDWASSMTATHSYNMSGVYSVKLKVKDDLDIESEWSDPLIVDVQNTLPIADFDIHPKDGNVYTVFTFKSSSYDPDGEIKKYMWEFGDEKTTIEEGRNFTTHQYTDDKEFTVRLIVVDNDGKNSQPVTKTVVINNVKPNVKGTISKTEVFVNDPVTLDGTASWDDDDLDSDLTFEWKSEGKVLSKKAKATNIKFSLKGEYTIVLTVTDDDGKSNSTEFELVVKERENGGGGGGDDPQGLSMGLIGGIIGIIVVVLIVVLFLMKSQGDKKKAAVAAAAKPKKKPKKKKKTIVEEEEEEIEEAKEVEEEEEEEEGGEEE